MLDQEPLNLSATRGGGEVEADLLPAVPDGAAVEPKVFDGEVVEEAAPGPPRVPGRAGYVRPLARAAVRHAGYVAAGAVVAYRRRQPGNTLADQMARQLAAQGQHEQALAVLEHAGEERHKRHERWERRIGTLVLLAKHWRPVGVVTVGGMLAFGMASGDPAGPFQAAAELARWTVDAMRVAMLASPAVALATLHQLGRTAGELAPGWSLTAKQPEEDRGLVVTADGIVVALQNLSIPKLDKAFKDKWAPHFLLTPVRDRRGYEAEFSVPMGVTAEMIADKRPVLARNLHREEIETWPSAGKPGYVKLWVANPGAISKAAPEYPLLHEGQADVFEGVPGGVLARGDGALIPVVAANGVLGGLMGQGKSNAARVIMLGCCTDPICGLDVFVFANNGDFDAYEPRLAVYRKGLDDDVIDAAMERLHEAYRDVGDREQMLADLGAKKVTRALAQKYPELRPHVSLYSECHELFGHPEYGEEAGELAVKIVKRQRKTARAAWFDTQSSRKAAIPGALVELVSVNCCFAVKSWRNNDGFLGDGSFAAGIRATELRPGRDRGTSLATGISDEQFELLRWYFIAVDDDTGRDDARPVIERCMGTVDSRTPVAGSMPTAITVRDLLDDIAAVTEGPDRVNVNDLPALLKRLDGTWPEYRKLTGAQLRKRLTELGVRTTNTDNRPELDPAELRRVIAAREESG